MSIAYTGAVALFDVDKKFSRTFNTAFKNFWDKELTIMTMEVKIDLLKFDDWLHLKHGDYEVMDKSMSMIIKEEYGEEANDLITELI